MLLTEEQEVIDLIGQSNRVGNTTTARQNLYAATTQIENHLGTSLARTERVDYFGCPTNVQQLSQTPAYILNLSQGFIDPTAAFEVFYSNDGLPILDIGDANAELQDADAYGVDYEKGRVTLFGTTAIPDGATVPFRSIAIHYTAGFAVNDNDIAEDVPQPLRDGAKFLTANNMQIATGNQTTKQPYRWMRDNNRRQITGILSAYIRPRTQGDNPQVKETI